LIDWQGSMGTLATIIGAARKCIDLPRKGTRLLPTAFEETLTEFRLPVKKDRCKTEYRLQPLKSTGMVHPVLKTNSRREGPAGLIARAGGAAPAQQLRAERCNCWIP